MSRSKSLHEAVIDAQTGFFKSKSVDEKGYLALPEDNLIEPFPNCWKKIKEELGKGAGRELEGHFLAVHSSSALCVNNFAPFKEHCTKLSFLGYSGFKEAQFEKKQPTGLRGTPPHLDFYLESPEVVIGVESKFTEHGGVQAPNHSTRDRTNNLEKYRNRKELSYLPKGFQESIIEHYSNDDEPQHLDVAQLIKHTIGLLNNRNGKKAVLAYLYWEPLNPTIDSIFAEHRRNFELFKRRIEQFIEFVPLSYPEFWKQYENDTFLKDHFRKVKERYGFAIKSL